MDDPGLFTHLINWIQGPKWVKLLGIPFWEGPETDDFWEELYLKIKKIVAGWKRHIHASPFGKVMLINFMIYSRVRYVEQVMVPPKWFDIALEEDIQALLWSKEFRPIADEIGTVTEYTRWMVEDAQTNKTKDGLGLGKIDWPAHAKALRARWGLRYLDPSQGPWKQVLDQWLTRSELGRGAILSSYPIAELTCSTTYRTRHFPLFWRKVIEDLRALNLTPAPNTLTREGARSYSVWYPHTHAPPEERP